MIFSNQSPQDLPSRKKHRLSDGLVFALTLAATAMMMLCPCDVVGIHDYQSISLVGLATVFGIAATVVAFRRMRRDSGITGFLRALVAVAIVGVSIYVELFVAMEIVALMARRR